MGTSTVQQSKNPFSAIPVTEQECVKVWDMTVDVHSIQGMKNGRFRILAVVPKKPLPLENIRFSIAWCSPTDLKLFTKQKANMILVNRWLSAFANSPKGKNGEIRKIKNTGVIKGPLDSLKNFWLALAKDKVEVPFWAQDFGCFFPTKGKHRSPPI